jgi:hypothetical protein
MSPLSAKNQVLALLLPFATLGCAAVSVLGSAKAVPAEVAVPISSAGPLPPIEVVAPVCDYVSAELRFPRNAFADQTERDALIGKGTPISIRVSIARIEHGSSATEQVIDYQTWIATTDGIQGWANDYVFRILGGTTLPRGSYRVRAELLEGHPGLERTRPTFSIVSNFKNSPDRSRC